MNKKLNYLVIIFILLGPILDITNFFNLPFNTIIRGIFLVSITIYLIINKKEIKLLIPILIFSIVYFLYQIFYLKYGLILSISTILKLIYLPISILFFKEYSLVINKDKLLLKVILLYIILYLFSYIFKIGGNAYLDIERKQGFKGMFSSINEFSAIITCLLPIVINYLKENKKYISILLIIITSLICSLLIGTKILTGGIIIIVLYFLYQEKNIILKSKYKVFIITSFILLAIIGCILFTKTRTYNNMIIQKDYFNVDNIISIEFINKVIFNDRLTFLYDNYNYFINQDIIKILLGIGINDSTKLVEIDIFDIIFRYGIIGLICFLVPIVSVIKNTKLRSIDRFSLILLILISLSSGHVLIYPAVSIYLALTVNRSVE